MEMIMIILRWILLAIVLKSLTVGSNFSFHLWLKYKKEYTDWYFNRPTFKAKE